MTLDGRNLSVKWLTPVQGSKFKELGHVPDVPKVSVVAVVPCCSECSMPFNVLGSRTDSGALHVLRFSRRQMSPPGINLERCLHWVFEAKKRCGLSVGPQLHLLLKDTGPAVIARSMQLIAGRTAQEYSHRKGGQGAFAIAN